jgi:hypothetical protein
MGGMRRVAPPSLPSAARLQCAIFDSLCLLSDPDAVDVFLEFAEVFVHELL